MDAAEHIETTARQTGSNTSHGSSAAGAAAAPSSPGNSDQLSEGRHSASWPCLPGVDDVAAAPATLPPSLAFASTLSGSGPSVFRCVHNRSHIKV